jgi:hypothetical protein
MIKENSALKDLLTHKDNECYKIRMGYENKVQKVNLLINLVRVAIRLAAVL